MSVFAANVDDFNARMLGLLKLKFVSGDYLN